MYAYGLICSLVCDSCEDKPCPRRSWLAKNACPKIIACNERLGRCCATCMHCVDGRYCGEKARGANINPNTDFDRWLIREDIFANYCEKWTNEYQD